MIPRLGILMPSQGVSKEYYNMRPPPSSLSWKPRIDTPAKIKILKTDIKSSQVAHRNVIRANLEPLLFLKVWDSCRI